VCAVFGSRVRSQASEYNRDPNIFDIVKYAQVGVCVCSCVCVLFTHYEDQMSLKGR